MIAELQRLLPLESVNDLFLYKAPDTPNSKTYSIRPFLAADEEAVYTVFTKTSYGEEDGGMEFESYPNLIADKYVIDIISPLWVLRGVCVQGDAFPSSDTKRGLLQDNRRLSGSERRVQFRRRR